MSLSMLRPGGLKLTALAADTLKLGRNSRVLDLGCGAGGTLAFLREQYGCRVSGADTAEDMLDRARKLVPEAELLLGNAEALPFSDGSFDAVFLECSLSVMVHPERALAEAARVLKSGGGLTISTLCCAEGAELKDQGRLVLPVLRARLEQLGFSLLLDRDCSDELTQMLVDAVMKHGSLCAYFEALSRETEAPLLTAEMPVKGTGYRLFCAEKK